MRNFTKEILVVLQCLICINITMAQNPIVPDQGLNDPHIHIFNDKAYVYASHDKSADNDKFTMEDWWVWSSPDLVNWTKECVLKPGDTYIGEPFYECWATDVGFRNGKYYWYFSERNRQTGVVVGDSPTGPWKDPLGEPLLTSDLTPTHEYDMAIFEEGDAHYIIFGVWDFYIAKLNDDMISLAEMPKKIEIHDPRGPYNRDGKNEEMPTDDKPSVHKYNGKYYLSWGCFYAMADQLEGPYQYRGTVINEESFAPGYKEPTWPNGFLQGRHGNFFEWNNQWFYTYCDISQTGNRYFRDAFISYIHYKENGEMAPIRIDGVGVGRYEALHGKIEAEDYFKSNNISKVEFTENEFAVRSTSELATLNFPNVEGLGEVSRVEFTILNKESGKFSIELWGGEKSKVLGMEKFNIVGGGSGSSKISVDLVELESKEDFQIVIHQGSEASLYIDSFTFFK